MHRHHAYLLRGLRSGSSAQRTLCTRTMCSAWASSAARALSLPITCRRARNVCSRCYCIQQWVVKQSGVVEGPMKHTACLGPRWSRLRMGEHHLEALPDLRQAAALQLSPGYLGHQLAGAVAEDC